MNPKRYFGLGLIVLAIAGAALFDWLGSAQQPLFYTLEFERGTTLAAGAKTSIAQIAAVMAHNNALTATITGHTGTRGDANANLALGRRRAAAVASALVGEGIDKRRMRTFSAGDSQPLERRADEGDRGYQSRLARARLRLEP